MDYNINKQDSSPADMTSPVKKQMWLGGMSSCFANLVSAFADPKPTVEPEELPWEIPPEEITDQRFLGAGSQGMVYTGCWRGEMVAIKKVNDNFESSAEHLRYLDHENIIRFLGVTVEKPLYGIVMELAQYGSLYQFLHSGSNLLPSQLMRWAKDVAAGMAYLNEHNVIHRDLKSPNVLISDNYVAKVSDFGTSREWRDVSTVMTFKGTIAWMAPEVIRNQLCSDRIDVWSYGVLLWEIVTREIPYKPFEPHTILWAVGGDKISLPIPSGCPQTLQVLINQCWQKVPKHRPSFKIIVANLELVAEEFERLDSKTFAHEQASWGAEVRVAMENIFDNHNETMSLENRESIEDTQTMRQNLRLAREMYLEHVAKADTVYMDACALQLQLEQREKEVAEREKHLQSCRCGQLKPIKIRRQESSTSSETLPVARQPRKKPTRHQTQLVANYVDGNQGRTYTTVAESCPCIKQNVYNNNLINNTRRDPVIDESAPIDTVVKETVLEENGNVSIHVIPLPNYVDNVPDVAAV